ncbi:YbaK/EbsC family protein [Microcella sp.]|uniref:YbaK/EbsC family protein n=1 Tax=Microcella sp. TaxID=1913979 RepID=UPI003F6F4772
MSTTRFGTLELAPAAEHPELLAAPVRGFLAAHPDDRVLVGAIDAELADTAAFCAHYGVDPSQGANCVVVEAKRGETRTLVACMILGSDRIDVNGAVRRMLDARRASFAPLDAVIEATGMQYGGVTPLGLPPEWVILVDEAVAASGPLIVGAGIRGAKLLVTGKYLATLPGARVVPIAQR